MRFSRSSILVAFFVAVSTYTAFAGAPVIDGKSSKALTPPCPPDTLDWLNLKSSFTFDSDFKRGEGAKGNSWSKEIEYAHRIPIHLSDWPHIDCGQWYLRLGADYTRWDFENKGGLPIPNTLQSAAAIVALEYVVNDSAALMLETRPGVYFEHKVRSQSFDAPTTLYVPIYHRQTADSSFTLVAGVYYSGLLKESFLPVGGFVWNTGKWAIRVVVPEPRITYQATERLGLWVGGQVTGGGFGTDSHQVDRKPNLNHAVVTYDEYRAEAGFSYKIAKCTMDVGAGYAFRRKFDYFRAEEGFRTDEGAPFVKVELRTGF